MSDKVKKKVNWLPVLALVAVNLIPLYGVFYWGWSILTLLVLYWLETFIIGVFNVIKILMSPGGPVGNMRMAGFFTVHYGMFWAIHGVFLFVLIVPLLKNSETVAGVAVNNTYESSMKWVLLLMVVSHLISFLVNFLPQRRRGISADIQMMKPYGRVIVMHLVILGTAFLAKDHTGSLVVLALLVGLKIVTDVAGHMFSNAFYYDTEKNAMA